MIINHRTRRLQSMSKKITDQKTRRRLWDLAALKKRRERYRKDPEYKKKVNQYNLERYRSAYGKTEQKNCRDNLNDLESFGTLRELTHTGKEGLTFTSEELGSVLGGYDVQTIYRWVRLGVFPEPVYKAYTYRSAYNKAMVKTSVNVYLAREVSAFIPVIADHQDEYYYLSQKHKETINALQKAARKARS